MMIQIMFGGITVLCLAIATYFFLLAFDKAPPLVLFEVNLNNVEEADDDGEEWKGRN